ncbi:hypothetical protein TNIN_60191 [Trichonephila inaurata madagascariensis]|uniref:Uncharacterized protein n=1 Tax=Trichonephila inaurata madagascariensis TaxID=2747483 RepID=A0A8X7C9J3_9ARAC|nr:hypothetical protein TNIN_60191 [Trichonephila inaurata madagascariensis]
MGTLFTQAVVCQTYVMTTVRNRGLLDNECTFQLRNSVGRHDRSQLSILLHIPPVTWKGVSMCHTGNAMRSPRRPDTCILASAILGLELLLVSRRKTKRKC